MTKVEIQMTKEARRSKSRILRASTSASFVIRASTFVIRRDQRFYHFNKQFHRIIADFDFDSFDARQRLENDFHGERFALNVIAELLDGRFQLGRIGDDPHANPVGELAIHLLAAVLDRRGPTPGRCLRQSTPASVRSKARPRNTCLARPPSLLWLAGGLECRPCRAQSARRADRT